MRNVHLSSERSLRSGTAVGALIREADHADNKADFVRKMAIDLKEVTDYWIELSLPSETVGRCNSTNPRIVKLRRPPTNLTITGKSERGAK